MDPLDDYSEDPAADFLAREQEELGELGEELGITPHIQLNDMEEEEEVSLPVVAIPSGLDRAGNGPEKIGRAHV